MIRRRTVRLLLLCIAALMAFHTSARATETPSAPERQILVMVRQAPDHYRPNGAYGAYGNQFARTARQHLAQRIARQYGLTLVEDWPMPMIDVDCFVMAVPEGRSRSAAIEQVSHDSDVAWAQPVEVYTTQASSAPPNDPLFRAEPAASEWHLADLHRIADGRGVKVAVVDSGIETRHPDLAGQVILNRNFVAGRPLLAEQHGTSVAGVIAAKAGNGIGIAGVAPGARLLGLRACWQMRPASTVCDSLSLAKAIYFAADHHADIINLSLGGPDDRLLRELLKAAMARGATVVSAFDNKRPNGGFPASVPGVIAVSDTALAPSRGDVYTAPGRDVPTTEPGGRWFLVNGSSYAAAHVSGLLALIRENRRAASVTFVSQRRGGGAIDACATLRVARGCDCSCGPTRFASSSPRS